MKVLCIKNLSGLLPIDKCKAYDNLRVGDNIVIDIKSSRNYQFHKKFFALLNLAYENQENYISLEHFREDIIIASGYYTERTNYLTGEIKLVADSISFASMDNDEFNVLYDKVLNTLCKVIGVGREDLMNELLQFG